MISAPVNKVFGSANWPGCFEAAIPDFMTRAAVLFEGTVEHTEVVANQRIVAKVSFPGEHPNWTFTFEPLDSGTKLTIRVAWHLRAPVDPTDRQAASTGSVLIEV